MILSSSLAQQEAIKLLSESRVREFYLANEPVSVIEGLRKNIEVFRPTPP